MSTKLKEFMETPTASINITTNGTHDVTNYASAVVTAQKPEQTKTATPKVSQQTVTPDSGYALSSVTVNRLYEEVSTVADLEAKMIDANIGKMYKFTGTSGDGYYNGGLYIVEVN